MMKKEKRISLDSISEPQDSRSGFDANPAGHMRSAAIRHIGISRKSSGQVRQFLNRQFHDADLVEQTIAALTDEGYIDDQRVGRRILRDRQAGKAESKAAIRNRMVRQGVPDDVAEQLSGEGAEDHDTAALLVRHKFGRDLEQIEREPIGEKRRLIMKMNRFLISRGYSPEIVRKTVHNAMNGLNYDDDLLE